VAIDIQPGSKTLASVRKPWTEANAAAGRVRATCGDYSGAPSHAEFRGAVQSIEVVTEPGVAQSLKTGGALTPAQINNFTIHLELVERFRRVPCLAVIANAPMAPSAHVSSGNVIGTFPTKESADRECANGTADPWLIDYSWQCVVKARSRATGAGVGPPAI